MKCALELTMIAAVKAEEQKILDAVKEEQERQNLIKETIAICERMGNLLEKQAMSGKAPIITFRIDYNSWLHNHYFLEPTTKDYADNRLSYKVGKQFDFDAFKKWFAEYCFEVEAEMVREWVYGWGHTPVFKITVKPAIECLKE